MNSFVLRDGTRYSTPLLETLNYTDVSLIRQAKRMRRSRTLRIACIFDTSGETYVPVTNDTYT